MHTCVQSKVQSKVQSRRQAQAPGHSRAPRGQPLLTGLSVAGSIDGEVMLFFVEEMLAPLLKAGDVVIMDNVATHKQEEIEDLIEARGALVIFLPPYSPDLNPIENCWSKVKTILRSLKPRTLEELLDALVEAFSSITIDNILGWFTHCGYQAAPT